MVDGAAVTITMENNVSVFQLDANTRAYFSSAQSHELISAQRDLHERIAALCKIGEPISARPSELVK
jgi:hypothetical protein